MGAAVSLPSDVNQLWLPKEDIVRKGSAGSTNFLRCILRLTFKAKLSLKCHTQIQRNLGVSEWSRKSTVVDRGLQRRRSAND